MSDEQENSPSEIDDAPRSAGRLVTRRRLLLGAGITALIVLVLLLSVTILYRVGVFDNYIKEQFVAKMAEIGVTFSATKFRVTASPLALELEGATFNDTTTGEKLFTVQKARLGLTIVDLVSWKLSRDISIDTTDVTGAEVWVKFDENGRSNFANLKLVENKQGGAVNFRYDSTTVSIKDTVVHFGDISRSIAANGNNVSIDLVPDRVDAADNVLRFKFNVSSHDSDFAYDDRKFEDISITAKGVADEKGAEIESLKVSSPVGDTALNGRISNWADPQYELDAESTLDLTQISMILATGTSLRGVGNFKGHITGHGEQYKVEGTADTEAFRADGVYLKGANINGTVEGTNSNYTANGTAIAEMLTFDDFRLDLVKLAGNVRGTGTDFRWVGELQAAAAKTPAMTIGGLFLADAAAEYRDKQLAATVGNGRVKRFAIGDTEFEDLQARNLKFSMPGGNIDISAPNAVARSFKTPDYQLNGVSGQNVRIKHSTGKTDIDATNLRSQNGKLAGANVDGVSADRFKFRDLPASTKVDLGNLRARRVESEGTVVEGVESPDLAIENANGTTIIYSDKARVAKIDTGSAVLGSLNIAGIRLTIRNGTVEGRSNDIDAGTIALVKNAQLPTGGTLDGVKINHPVFVLERAGRYRASADMSIGGGALGSVSLGAATAKVNINNERAELSDLQANVMDGSVTGTIAVAFNSKNASKIDADFTDLDLSKLAAIQSGRVIPLEGKTTGTARLTFAGTNFRTASGTLDASINANAGTAERGLVPINGRIELVANTGLFEIREAKLNTDNSQLTATGKFDLKDNGSDLALNLTSTDASEIDKVIRVTGVSPEIEQQLDDLQVTVGGDLAFNGTVKGNLFDPDIDGKASIGTVALRGRTLGAISSDILVSTDSFELKNGKLVQPGGGSATFDLIKPSFGSDNTSINATLTNVNAGDLLAALPVDLPERIRDVDGKTSGTVNISGLPDAANGRVDIAAANGTIAGQSFDNLVAKAAFSGTLITVETAQMNVGTGKLTATGSYDRASSNFNADVTAKDIPLPLILAALPQNSSIPALAGTTNLTLKATGNADRFASVIVDGNGTATGVTVGDSTLGDVIFDAKTAEQKLQANLTASFDGKPQRISATIDLGSENLPLVASTEFNDSPLSPFLAFIPQLKGIPLSGSGTGRIDFGGDLSTVGADGKRSISASKLSGSARFTALALQIQDTPLNAAEPIVVRFDPNQITFDSARFTGGGSNVAITGVKALSDSATNNLSIDGRINLSLLNLRTKDIFFAGNADVSVRLAGPNSTARLLGTVATENAAIAAFVGSDRLTFERVKTRVIFTSDQAEIESASGYLGGGKFTADGGALLDGLAVKNFRLTLNGENVTVPFPADFLTTGDARLEVTGIRRNPTEGVQITIAGRVYANRSLYSKDIDLANIVGARRERALSAGVSSFSAPRFDLVIEGRDALVVKNNIADLTASVSLRLAGDTDNPILSGRITANGGTLIYRHTRYEIQRGTLEFPPDTFVDPVLTLQAEGDVAGYQVFASLSGQLSDSETLNASLRSSPALPQADIVSLITTGALTNSAGGIPTLAQTGITTAAEILTDSVINNPARRATDKLFGLNVFEIDPILSGQQLNPGARLTVGRQINNNLRVTYSTNLSEDQNQVLALEYRVSNKLSFVALYEQRSLSNVTRHRDNFSFEIRFKRRF